MNQRNRRKNSLVYSSHDDDIKNKVEYNDASDQSMKYYVSIHRSL